MSPLELVRRLYVAGVDVSLNDEGGIRVSRTQPPPDLVDELKTQRDDVIALLREQRLGELDDGFGSPVPRRYIIPETCLSSFVCARLGPCNRHLMRLPCDRDEPGP